MFAAHRPSLAETINQGASGSKPSPHDPDSAVGVAVSATAGVFDAGITVGVSDAGGATVGVSDAGNAVAVGEAVILGMLTEGVGVAGNPVGLHIQAMTKTNRMAIKPNCFRWVLCFMLVSSPKPVVAQATVTFLNYCIDNIALCRCFVNPSAFRHEGTKNTKGFFVPSFLRSFVA